MMQTKPPSRRFAMSAPTAFNPIASSTTAPHPARIAFASFIGTAIEFYDFYIYATAAALVIGPLFFPQVSASAQALTATARCW